MTWPDGPLPPGPWQPKGAIAVTDSDPAGEPATDRDHVADARRIALDHITGLADTSPMLMAEVLDANLADHDTDLIAEDLGILVGMLRDLVSGWDGGGDA